MSASSDNVLKRKPLTPDRLVAIDVYLRTGSQQEAARAAKVTDRTMRRWLLDPDFLEGVELGIARMLDAVAIDYARGAKYAVALQWACMTDKTQRMKDRLDASKEFIAGALLWNDARIVRRKVEELRDENESD